VNSYDHRSEALSLSQNLRNSVAQGAIAGASGIGLGAIVVAAVGTAAADVTGILAGLVLLSLGLYIIPARRTRAKRDFDEKMEELRTRLHDVMQEQFHKELNNATSRVQDAIAPYTRFVRAEQEKTTAMRERITQLNDAVLALRNTIENVVKG
jgi:ABC-type transport system involved in cytochrome bd biosynthesis fused ATPase/permease subunit